MSEQFLSLLLHSGVGLLAGMAVGLAHFATLWWNTRLFTGSGSIFAAFGLQLGRFAMVVAVFFGLAKFGALPLLAGALGLLLARHIVIKRIGGVA